MRNLLQCKTSFLFSAGDYRRLRQLHRNPSAATEEAAQEQQQSQSRRQQQQQCHSHLSPDRLVRARRAER